MPRATSSAREPVGITCTGGRLSSPRRMTEPLPNCLSICDRATSSALLRSLVAGFAAGALRAAMVILSSAASPACGCPGLECHPSPRRHDEYATGHRHLRPARITPVDDTRRSVVAHKLKWNTCSTAVRHAVYATCRYRSQESIWQRFSALARADPRDESSAHPRARFPRTGLPRPHPD